MRQRILSTFLLWTLVLVSIGVFRTTGGVWLLSLIAVLTLREFYALVRRLGVEPFNRVGMLFGGLITLAPLYAEPYGIGPAEFLAAAVVVFCLRILRERGANARVEALAWTLFGLVYIPFMLHFLVRIILISEPDAHTGLVFAIWLIAVSKFCDVGALLTGLACGRHPMAPIISPKKTWEGAVGGVLTSALIGAAIAHVCRDYLPDTFTPWLAAIVALPVASLAIVSDLVESVIKRRVDAKDAGRTIPGIGGVFDLSDSLILTAPLGYIVFTLL